MSSIKTLKVFELCTTYSKASVHLDFLRSIAALEVLLCHFRSLFYVSWSQLNSHNSILDFFYFITNFGHQSVIVFFVLSGFFVGSSVLRSVEKNNWSWINYLINRIVRLEIALLPSLILCTVFDFSGLAIFGENNVYPALQNGQNVVSYNIIGSLNLNYFLGNLFFLQTITVPTYGSNTPLWSLSNEFWYYILFPLLIMCSVKGNKKVIYLLLLSITSVLLGKDKIFGFFIWMGGVIVALTPKIILSSFFVRQSITVISVLIIIVSLATSKFQAISNYSDYLIGIGTSFLVYSIIQTEQCVKEQDKKSNKIEKFYTWTARKFASFSYSLYLLHLPVLVFISCFFVRNNRWQPSLGNFFISLVILACVLLYSYCIALITEFRTNDVRKFINKSFRVVNQ